MKSFGALEKNLKKGGGSNKLISGTTYKKYHDPSSPMGGQLRTASFSIGMGLNQSKGITGRDWTSKIYFNPNADNKDGVNNYDIDDTEIRTKLQFFVETDETIEKAYIYKTPLITIQRRMKHAFHAFLVLETDVCYWSIEKNCEGLQDCLCS